VRREGTDHFKDDEEEEMDDMKDYKGVYCMLCHLPNLMGRDERL